MDKDIVSFDQRQISHLRRVSDGGPSLASAILLNIRTYFAAVDI